MRRALLTVCAATALALAACGEDEGGASSPLDEALGHLPADSPLVIVIETDLESDQYQAAEELLDKFPIGDQLIGQLESSIEDEGLDFQEDLEPLLGNPIVVGALDAKSLVGDQERFVAAIETGDADKLEDFVKREGEEVGEAAGGTIYENDEGDFVGVEGDVAVFGDSPEDVEEALERRDSDERLREEDVEEALEDLPDERVASVYVDIEELLEADPSTAIARRIPWIDGLSTLGMSVSIEEDGIAFDLAAATEGVDEDELPFAAGGESPGIVAGDGEIGVGVRDLGHIVRFAEAAGQAANPEGFEQYSTGKQALESQLGVDLDRDLIAQLSGNVSVSFDIEGGFAVRADLEDPAAFERTLDKVATVLPQFAEGAGLGDDLGVARPRGGEDFYAIADPGGGSVVFGVVDDVFVASDDPARAAELAAEEPQPVPGANGSVAVRANTEQLAQQIISQLGGAEAFGASLFTGPLGDLTGSILTGEDGMRVRLRLEIE